MKWIVMIFAAALLGGCSLTREVPPVQSYHLDTNISIAPAAGECGGRVIRVALIGAPQGLEGTDIYYSAADQKTYRYTRSRWEEPPAEQLQQIVQNSLVASTLFGGVVPYQSLAKNDWLLEIRIEKMTQHIDGGGQGTTALQLYAVLIDRYSRRILGQKAFRYSHTGVPGNAQSAVEAWNRGSAAFAGELVRWLRQQCIAVPEPDRSDVDL